MKALLLCLLLAGCSGTYRLIERNDALTPFNKDQEFTQGLEVQYDDNAGSKYSLFQDIYTPRDKRSSGKVKGERPYAGYLGGRYEQAKLLTDEANWFWGVEAGIIGPNAGGKYSQCTIHELLGQDCPTGWSNELSEKFLGTGIFGVQVTRDFELYFTSPIIEHSFKIEVGNKTTGLTTSHLLQWGLGSFDVYSGPRIHLVAYDVFLDSDPDRRELDVRKNPWYAEYILGVRGHYEDLIISWQLALSTPQYEASRGNYGYGQLTIEYKY